MLATASNPRILDRNPDFECCQRRFQNFPGIETIRRVSVGFNAWRAAYRTLGTNSCSQPPSTRSSLIPTLGSLDPKSCSTDELTSTLPSPSCRLVFAGRKPPQPKQTGHLMIRSCCITTRLALSVTSRLSHACNYLVFHAMICSLHHHITWCSAAAETPPRSKPALRFSGYTVGKDGLTMAGRLGRQERRLRVPPNLPSPIPQFPLPHST